MIIPITIHPASLSPSSSGPNPKLPPSLARLSNGEVVLIELQGALAVECTELSERDGRLVGRLRVEGTDTTPSVTLVIGNHLLEGKVAALPKPLAVLMRSRVPDSVQKILRGTRTSDRGNEGGLDDDGDADDADGDSGEVYNDMYTGLDNRVESHSRSGAPAGWDMVAIVKRKIVFSKRPMPITGSAVLTIMG